LQASREPQAYKGRSIMLIPLILSGGSGTRLWPVSRRNLPKQFLSLAGHGTLFQQTVARTRALPEVTAPIVVASEDHRFLAAEQLLEAGIDGGTVVLEPLARNTAPAIALGALEALKRDPEAVLLVLPADHLITDTAAFAAAVTQALPLARQGWLATFGIRPDRAETGFGYIRRGEALGAGAFRVERFVEKPDLATAEGYLADCGYDWNSGMFLFRADRYLEELAAHAPAMLAAVRAAHAAAHGDLDFVRLERHRLLVGAVAGRRARRRRQPARRRHARGEHEELAAALARPPPRCHR